MRTLAGSVVWITGASSGIGRSLASALASQGATLVLSSRDEAALQEVCAAAAHPGRHHVVPLDLGRADTMAERVGDVLARAGQVDILVNNAGISQRALAAETALDVDRRIMEVNYFGTIALTKALLPSMQARGAGHIVTVTSLVGKFGSPLRSTYAASKHALHGFMDSLRAEIHADGITVGLICPGFIRTQVSHHALTADGSPQGRMDHGQEHGMDPDVCAARMVRAIAARHNEVYIGGLERWAVTLNRFAPGLFRRILRTARVT